MQELISWNAKIRQWLKSCQNCLAQNGGLVWCCCLHWLLVLRFCNTVWIKGKSSSIEIADKERSHFLLLCHIMNNFFPLYLSLFVILSNKICLILSGFNNRQHWVKANPMTETSFIRLHCVKCPSFSRHTNHTTTVNPPLDNQELAVCVCVR